MQMINGLSLGGERREKKGGGLRYFYRFFIFYFGRKALIERNMENVYTLLKYLNLYIILSKLAKSFIIFPNSS